MQSFLWSLIGSNLSVTEPIYNVAIHEAKTNEARSEGHILDGVSHAADELWAWFSNLNCRNLQYLLKFVWPLPRLPHCLLDIMRFFFCHEVRSGYLSSEIEEGMFHVSTQDHWKVCLPHATLLLPSPESQSAMPRRDPLSGTFLAPHSYKWGCLNKTVFLRNQIGFLKCLWRSNNMSTIEANLWWYQTIHNATSQD